MINRAWGVAATLLLVVTVALSVHFSTTGEDYGVSNRGWNGISIFFETVHERGGEVIADPGLLTGYEDSLLLVVAPVGMPEEGGFGAYRAFLERGNTVVIIDEGGTSNVMLQSLGALMRVVPGTVSSLDSAYASPFFPSAHPAADHLLLADVESVTFNRPAHVTGGNALLVSGVFTWEDQDGDGRMETGEPSGTYSFLAREEIGGGEVIVCADQSLLINAMQEGQVLGENRGFVENLMAYRGTLLIDGAVSTATEDHAVLAGFRDAPMVQAGLLAAVLFAAAFLWRRKYRRGWVHGT
ncbi:DUF4350 domain-containing protein [Methanofollis sp. W23]|uniref:DUF4350 domain-containing protein n=1 Tax=Methanofollis sp. W23 TaxID=2817849 RepID=UPI001AE5EBEB|nr:DUF4350 domain-containing protein [Methanofollis sp. W23]